MAYGLPDEGTRRLRAALGGFAVVACLVVFGATLALHGVPYWSGWWAIMAVVLAASYVVARGLVPALEWIIAGYLGKA